MSDQQIVAHRATASDGGGGVIDAYGATAEDAKQRAQGKMQYSPNVSIVEVVKFTIDFDDFLLKDNAIVDAITESVVEGTAEREVIEE